MYLLLPADLFLTFTTLTQYEYFKSYAGASRSEDCSELSASRCIRTRGCEWGRDRCYAGYDDSVVKNCFGLKKSKCKAQGCYWDKNNKACRPEPPKVVNNCSGLKKSKCKAQGCYWDNDNKACRPKPPKVVENCFGLKKSKCKARGCYWDKNNKACRTEPPKVIKNCFGLEKSECNQAEKCIWFKSSKTCMSILRDAGRQRWLRR